MLSLADLWNFFYVLIGVTVGSLKGDITHIHFSPVAHYLPWDLTALPDLHEG